MAHLTDTPTAKLELPVEIIGADIYGQQFFEIARTVTIHRTSLSILLETKLAPETEVVVRNPETNKETIARVVAEARQGFNGHVYGLIILDPSADLWQMRLPDAATAETVELECDACHSAVSFNLSEIELEIFKATKQLTLPCATCKCSSVWKRASRAPAPDPQISAPKPAESSWEECRQNRRMPMKTTACVRFSGVETIVECEDVSKGGCRFTSRKQYPAGTRVEVAVPYTKFSTNIFSLAGIVYCRKLPDGQFRHGVTYLKNRGAASWDP
jgi:PilZ domain